MEHRIIVIDDEPHFLDSVRRGLFISGFKQVTTQVDPLRAAEIIRKGRHFDIALIDISMPGMQGTELLEKIKEASPATECIMITASNEARLAVKCLKRGAYDYLVKPITREDLVLAINRALERKRLFDILDLGRKKGAARLTRPDAFSEIVTAAPQMERLLREAELHADSDVPILITGESGTGKELLARAIHSASSRADQTFIPINMASVSATLFDAEFFGHTKGAFTGADKDRGGYLTNADKGTLFLDEIGNLPIELQGKLLRFLQDGEFIKLGTSNPRRTDVRIIAATNEDLDRLVSKNRFRKDLYYRLRGGWLHLPPLRERRDDIPLLVNHFLAMFSPDGPSQGVTTEAMDLFSGYEYPGNIRELKSIIQSALNLSKGKPIPVNALPAHLRNQRPAGMQLPEAEDTDVSTLAEMEKDHILRIYRLAGNNKSKTARLLGIGLNTLRRKLETYGVA